MIWLMSDSFVGEGTVSNRSTVVRGKWISTVGSGQNATALAIGPLDAHRMHLFLFGTVLDNSRELNVVEHPLVINWSACEHFVAFFLCKPKNNY